jgi:hypothetical protein
VQVDLARGSLHDLMDISANQFLKLNRALAYHGKALDRYGFVLRKFTQNTNVEDLSKGAQMASEFIVEFQKFFVDLETYTASLRSGVIPFQNDLALRLFENPDKLSQKLKYYLRGSCDQLTLSD